MPEIDPILLKIDKLISISRLKEIAFIIGTDVTERVSKISAVLDGLKAGAYLLGTGPSTVGIIYCMVYVTTKSRWLDYEMASRKNG